MNKWTPEPWREFGIKKGAIIFQAQSIHKVGWMDNFYDAIRAVECVNNCANIPHPSAIPAMVEALRAVANIANRTFDDSCVTHIRMDVINAARAALEKAGMKCD